MPLPPSEATPQSAPLEPIPPVEPLAVERSREETSPNIDDTLPSTQEEKDALELTEENEGDIPDVPESENKEESKEWREENKETPVESEENKEDENLKRKRSDEANDNRLPPTKKQRGEITPLPLNNLPEVATGTTNAA